MLCLKVITAQKENWSLTNGLQHVGIYNLNFLAIDPLWPKCGKWFLGCGQAASSEL